MQVWFVVAVAIRLALYVDAILEGKHHHCPREVRLEENLHGQNLYGHNPANIHWREVPKCNLWKAETR